MIDFIMAHQTIASLVAYYVVSAFVGSLPSPQVNSTPFYQFCFKFLNTLAGNLARAFSSQLPVPTAQAQGVANAQATKDVSDKLADVITKGP